jgi:uncharacterized protein (TIGR02246 family)
MLRILLPILLVQSAPPPAPVHPDAAAIAAEVDKGVKAYNSQDLKFYEAALAPEVVYIADDGAIIAGKERVVRLFTRLFARTPPPQVAVSEVVTGGRGSVAWARFKWTLTGSEHPRKGVATTLFAREGDGWRVLQIQNTPDGHAAAAGH